MSMDLQAEKGESVELTEYDRDSGHSPHSGLAELAITCLRRKYLILGTIAVALAIGVVTLVVRPPKHGYSTSLEIGKITSGSQLAPIEASTTARAKLVTSYIPAFQEQQKATDPEAPDVFDIRIDIPKNTHLLVLKSEGPAAQAEEYLEAHRTVVNKLIEDHERSLESIQAELQTRLEEAQVKASYFENPTYLERLKKQLETELTLAEAELKELVDPKFTELPRTVLENKLESAELEIKAAEDDAGLLQFQLEHSDNKKKLRDRQIADLENSLAASIAQRRVAVSEAADADRAMTLLLIDDHISENRNRLATLEMESLALVAEKEQLEKTIEDNQRAQELAAQEAVAIRSEILKFDADTDLNKTRKTARVAEVSAQLADLVSSFEKELAQHQLTVQGLRLQLEALHPTRPVMPPTQSPHPINRPWYEVLAIAGALGLIAGLLAAVLLDFVAGVSRQMDRLEHRTQGRSGYRPPSSEA